MKIKLFLLFFVSINLYAKNLNEITQALEMSKRVTSMKEQTKSDIAQAEYLGSYNAPYLGLSISNADESNDNGEEYSVGISQEIAHPFASSSKVVAVQAKSRAIEQGASYALDILTLEVAKKYHQACISKEISQSLQTLYDEQNESFFKLQKAYEFGEISKKELLFNKLDLAKTQRSVTTYKRAYITELSNLQEMIDNLDIEELECNDLAKITKEIELKRVDEHALIKEITYEQNSAKSFYNVYNSTFSTIGYELLYEKELDTTRYTFGISVPLDFLSSKAELQRAEYLHKDVSLIAKKEYLTLEIQNSLKTSALKLKTLYEEFVLLEENVLPMSLELKDLAKKSLMEGHSSVLEYLDATRSYSKISLEFQEIKKDYYNELFEFYKKADIKGNL
ncbi:MAG TPA: TolC family protein [Sulfurimonas sp.]|uniref:TolC family protein n=1 Tax=Sulfurimonas sp. TaxID=2022749 RepID=UPI002B79CEF7|nr:TolC family protein [Sulfurimonas sp.]HUH41984.1 TolC family protein [Sulfurimonas sp.]